MMSEDVLHCLRQLLVPENQFQLTRGDQLVVERFYGLRQIINEKDLFLLCKASALFQQVNILNIAYSFMVQFT